MSPDTATQPMDVEEIAETFTDLVRQRRDREAGERFWSEGVLSIEPHGKRTRFEGPDEIREKHAWWERHVGVHQSWTDGPYVNGDQFTVKYTVDATDENGQRRIMSEIGLYTVANGQVVEERFFAVPVVTNIKDGAA